MHILGAGNLHPLCHESKTNEYEKTESGNMADINNCYDIHC